MILISRYRLWMFSGNHFALDFFFEYRRESANPYIGLWSWSDNYWMYKDGQSRSDMWCKSISGELQCFSIKAIQSAEISNVTDPDLSIEG